MEIDLEAPEGFTVVEGDLLRATQDIVVTFVPRNAKRTSSIQLWTRGQTIPRAEYEKRMDLYAGYENLEFK